MMRARTKLGRRAARLTACFILALMGMTARAQAQNLIRGAEWSLYQPTPGSASLEMLPGGGGLRIRVVKPFDPAHRIGLGLRVPAAIAADTRLRLRFEARSPARSPIRAVVEKNAAPYTKVLETAPTLTPEWKPYEKTGTAFAAKSGEMAARFHLGRQAGVVELRAISLESLGPDPAREAAKAVIAPEAAQERIRRIRMGDLKVIARDGQGRPIPNATVQVAQTRHAFLFGCNLYNLEPENPADWQQAYQERFAALFNYATLPFYWGQFEPESGRRNYARLEAMARWCRARGIRAKGHPLIWHEVYPKWAPKTAEETIPLLQQRVTDIISHFHGLISTWDVVNEATSARGSSNGVGAWARRDGAAKMVQTALQWARAAGEPGSALLYNDVEIGGGSLGMLELLRKRGALPDAIGLQSHMHGGKWPMTRVWNILETYKRLQRPLHFTEITVLNWQGSQGEQAQADYLEQFYTLLFSHPAVQSITYWDLSDRNAWKSAPAGLLRKDMTPRLAYNRLLRLIRRAWWTDETGTTDRAGKAAMRAFYGDYRVTARDAQGRAATETFAFPADSRAKTIVLTLR